MPERIVVMPLPYPESTLAHLATPHDAQRYKHQVGTNSRTDHRNGENFLPTR